MYRSVLQRLSHWAASDPGPAIEAPQRSWGYPYLWGYSGAIADALSRASPSPQAQVVALLLDDRMLHVAAMVAAMRTGAIATPLDPREPAARQRSMIEAVQPAAWIVDESAVPRLAALAGEAALRVVVLAEAAKQAVPAQWQVEWVRPWQRASFALAEPDPDAPAYIFFSSGSTGRPKPILGRTESLAQFVQWEIDEFALGPHTRVSQLIATTFDASLRDMFVPLCAGGTLCVPPRAVHEMEPARLLAWMEGSRVSLVHAVPTLFRSWLQAGLDGTRLAELRHVLLAGEALLPSDVRRWRAAFGERVELVNLYGTTETTMIKCFHRITGEDAQRDFIPIGKPMAGARAIVLDDEGRVCARGKVGELYLRSPYFSLGYYRQPERTAEVFVANPLTRDGSDLVYRTGDLALLLPDGNLRLLGRKDQQVKIQGIRVELGEIEDALMAHAEVELAAVVAVTTPLGETALQGYYVAPAALADEALHEHLAACLPPALIPPWTWLEAMPLTATGKVDRKALAARHNATDPAQTYVAPRSDVEHRLAAVYAEILETDRIGIQDNFFRRGGHSLRALLAVARIRECFGLEVPLRDFFAAPTVEQMGRLIEGRLREHPPGEHVAIVRVARDGPLPLSFAQRRLWFLDQLEPGNPSYNVPAAIRLTGPLDTAALQQSLNGIVRRHEVLRTTFHVVDGNPVQAIAAGLSIVMATIDLTALSSEEREGEAARLAQEESLRPFDLAAGPLLRATLLRMGAAEHILLLTLHHIVADAWSMGVLASELGTLYAAIGQGVANPLPELEVQYADVASWQRQRLQDDVLEQQTAYWKQRLAGAPALLELPTDRPRLPVQRHRGANFDFTLDAAVAGGLKALARRTGDTLFLALAAAFKVLLYRHSGQTDICLGTPIAGRSQAQTQPLIGCFINTLVLRTALDGNPRFEELLAQLRATALEAYAHQDVPFEQLVDAINPERSLRHSPLFQVMFTLHNAPRKGIELPQLTLQPFRAGAAGTTKFDLALEIFEDGDELFASFEYSTELFDAGTIERMAGHFTTLCEAVAADASARVAELPLLSERERAQSLLEWNRSDHAFPLEQTYAALFAQRVAAHPQRTACECDGERLSYQELDRRSSRIAGALVAAGAGPGVVVTLVAERGLALLTMMVGVLKAGAAFLSLDVQHPAERLRDIVRTSRSPLVLASRGCTALLDEIAAGLAATPTTLVAEAVWLRGEPPKLPARGGPDQLAYVVFTSGSTGKPKGVMVEQRGMLNNMLGKVPTLGLGEADRIAQTASPAFDISVWQFLAAPLVGACVHILPDAIAHDPARLAEAIEREQLSLLEIVPSLMSSLLEQCPPRIALRSLRWVLPTGEALPQPLARAWFARFPDVPLMNLYGPAECSDDVACHPFAEAPGENGAVPIGRPTPNNQLFILDALLQPVPVGVAGEICVAGVGVGRGYLHDAAQTAAAFVPHPFAHGARLYRSGDVGRRRADGSIVFSGRTDHQVKIRGHRIELGEIEAALAALPAVAQAVVVARADASQAKQLVAYVVPRQGRRIDAAALRSALLQSLPDYMVPAHFVSLAELPLTPNGKIDRSALPAPDQPRSLVRHVAPRTPTEETLARIWGEILTLERVGANDNFFDLGGHSLLATRLISQARSALCVDLPLRLLFEAPTVAGLAKLIDAMQVPEPEADVPPIVRVDRSRPLPLSFAQQRLWFLDRLEPGSAYYNVPAAVRLEGPFNVGALERTLNEIVRRHEVLRTSFATVDGTAVQVIAPELRIPVNVVDLTALSEAEREPTVRRMAEEEARQPFNLSTGPLLRAGVLRLAPHEHVLLLTLHHIVSDNWSMWIMVKEMAGLYRAFNHGGESPLPPLEVQYADFAHWQRQWLQGPVLERQLDYWRTQLAGAPALLELPADHPRPPAPSRRGARVRFTLSQETTASIAALSKRANATVFMTLATAFNVLLSRYSGQKDICIGTPIANRNHAGTEALIGFFVNTWVMRTRLHDNPDFESLLGQVRGNVLAAYANQDIPFEQLVHELRPERSLSHSPFFQVWFVLDNAGVREEAINTELTLDPIEADNTVAKWDLTLDMAEGEGTLSGTFEYALDLFEHDTIERMAAHFVALLEAVVAQPSTRIAELPLLTPAEQRQLVHWNDTVAVHAQDRTTVHERFERQAAQTPELAAVVFEGDELSYRELNARANQLAHHLRGMGVGPDTLVGLCVERSFDMVVGLLGILKAGGAYVPLDPSFPGERLAAMLADARPQVLLTQSHLRDLPAAQAIPTLCLDDDGGVLRHQPRSNPPNRTLPDHAVYVIYTSGSTGRPKGIVIRHRSALNLIEGLVHFVYRDRADLQGLRAGVNASFAFDASLSQLLLLLHGATLQLIPSRVRADVQLLCEAAHAWKLDVLDCTPSQLALLLRAAEPGQLPPRLLVGGEAIDPALWARTKEFPGTRFYNLYGPTETTVEVAICELGASGDRPVLGRPMENDQIHILDEHLNPLPVGVPGELYIAGPGLARGYLGRPDLTAERFIPNPFGSAGSRMYKSGDSARHLRDGSIEYLGRLDLQVKIRGFRVELGDIETALLRLPEVREAAVLLREDAPGDKRLAAYVVPAAGQRPEVAALRAALQQTLPDYMVPAHFVFLDTLPLTPNAKVDRQALPAPDMSRGTEGFVAPGTPTEQQLALIWAEVLGLDQVGIHDDFFDLGGDSLLAIRVLSQIQPDFAVELPLRALFEAGTIAELAGRIDAARGRGEEQLQAIPRADRSRLLKPSFAQQRLWFFDQLEPGNTTYNVALQVRLLGELNVGALQKTLNQIVRRHEVFRTTFAAADGVPFLRIADELDVPLPVTDLAGDPPAERQSRAEQLALEAANGSFDLARGPLMRASLLRMGSMEHIVLLTMHHIVSDGWSQGILLREVSALYNAYSQGVSPSLPELDIQYADFAQWQREWLTGEVLERQLDYWKNQLAGAPALLELPTDRPRPPVQSHRGDTFAFTMPPAVVAGLHAISRQCNATLFMTLAAAFKLLLARYSGQDDICIGTATANRNRREVEPLIGFFVNTLVLRTRLEGDPVFTELLARVRETALQAYAHQDIPFEQLVGDLAPQRSLSHSPLFQVMFALQNAPVGAGESIGLAVQPLVPAQTPAKFDLTLEMMEGEGELGGTFEYNADLFDRTTIERMSRHFAALCAAIVETPQARVGSLQMLEQAERRQLLLGWNDTAFEYPAHLTIHELVEEQVARGPERIALVFEDQRLSYAELNRRANRLAHHLRSLGVGPDVLVGLCVEPSVERIVGLLGILKAGGAYLPLDPAYPADRLAWMLEDADPPVLLTQEHLVEGLPPHHAHTLCLDSADELPAGGPLHNPPNRTLPAHLAYVIYTSGSTGRPKGVSLAHSGFCSLLRAQIAQFGIRPQQRILQFASFNFDASIWEIFLALASGASLCLAPRERMLPGLSLEETIRSFDVSVLIVPPSALSVVAAEPALPLQTIIVGGEACSKALVDTWAHRVDFFNSYGPTETTVSSVVHRCRSSDEGTPPIGRTVANNLVYILDRNLNPVPIGVAGEIHIGGLGLARGYLRRAPLTAERFMPDPFGPPGSRMYKTGDLARRRHNGDIEYLGRLDHQVKVRGFRVELGEIEATVLRQPDVREAVVLAREDAPGDKRIVAYAVPREGASLDVAALREGLARFLPDYMVPAHFVTLQEFPLTPNGKIDRAALPAPDLSAHRRDHVAARTQTEQSLSAIWSEVLKVEQVGVHDDFFEIGGHSLLATQLISRVRTRFGVDLPLTYAFSSPTVEQLAHYIDTAITVPGARPLETEETMALLLEELDLMSDDEAGAPASADEPLCQPAK